ncbi:hypothetical protein AgCh_028212 [Apium graveolens]
MVVAPRADPSDLMPLEDPDDPNPPFTDKIMNAHISRKFKMPTIKAYDGTSDPANHVRTFSNALLLQPENDAINYQAFPQTLSGMAQSRDELMKFLDKCCAKYKLEYDFFYLPIDFRTQQNKGYTFINFTKSPYAKIFHQVMTGYKWGFHKLGKDELVRHFEGSKFPCYCKHYLPVELIPPCNGDASLSRLTIVGCSGGRVHEKSSAYLMDIIQGKKESVKEYLNRFMKEDLKVPDLDDKVAMIALQQGTKDEFFKMSLAKRPAESMLQL